MAQPTTAPATTAPAQTATTAPTASRSTNKCTRLFVGEYTSKQTGAISQKVFAIFGDAEYIMRETVEEVKAMLAAGRNKQEVVLQDGDYGKYARFGTVSVEDLA